MEIASILKTARAASKLSQEQAAEALGVSRQTVSNWETGKSYPDILSVLKMSDLYSVSLDQLLKEGTDTNPGYRNYLKTSTDVVRSNERKSKLILAAVVFGVWALCFAAFFLLKDSESGGLFSLSVSWAVLPILFFAASWIVGRQNWLGRAKWLLVPLFGLLLAAIGSVSTLEAEGAFYRAVTWPDFAKLPVGLLAALAGLLAGILLRRREEKQLRDN